MELELKGLLDPEGGLNKQACTANAFLKLFSSAVCSESSRNLSILLEAVLRTNSKSTLHRIFMPKLEITGLHILVTMLWKFQGTRLLTAILRKGLRVLQHLAKHGVMEGRGLTHCTPRFCMHMIPKLIYNLTKHGDDQVRALASTLQKLSFQMPRETHSTHVSICEVAREKMQRKKIQEEEGLEEGEIPVEQE